MLLLTELILASQSPRRRTLLEQLGLTFRVVVSHTDETPRSGENPEMMVQRLALEKAETVATGFTEALTLAADTVVVHRGDVLGKPADAEAAAAMLRTLSGATHTVYTGIALVHPATERRSTAVEATQVTFGALSDAEIYAYVAGGSPMDKAGSYGIQDDYGAVFVSQIHGDYYNVVGLPLHRLYRLLHDQFADLLAAPVLPSF